MTNRLGSVSVADCLLLPTFQVKADKLREVKNGHDGTWVAHPALVTLALEIFNEHMPQPNQIDNKREDVHVTRENLLEVSCCPLCLDADASSLSQPPCP